MKERSNLVRECMRLIANGERELNKQVIIVDSVRVPKEETIDQFLDEVIACDGLE